MENEMESEITYSFIGVSLRSIFYILSTLNPCIMAIKPLNQP